MKQISSVIINLEYSILPFCGDAAHWLCLPQRALLLLQFRSIAASIYALNFAHISLDIFRQMKHNELTELEAWLYFLGSDDPQDILRIIDKYPMFSLLYQEIVDFRFHPKELISMYSKALSIMDKNTVQYMVDELKAQLVQQKAGSDAALAQRDAEIKQLRELLAEHEKRTK